MGLPEFVDYYLVLDISPDSTTGEIRAAYRRMALLVHPDHNVNDPNASQHMAFVNEAWETLRNEQKRAEFDQLRATFYNLLKEQAAYEEELRYQHEEYEANRSAWEAEQERIRRDEEESRRRAQREKHSAAEHSYYQDTTRDRNFIYVNADHTQIKKSSGWRWSRRLVVLGVIGIILLIRFGDDIFDPNSDIGNSSVSESKIDSTGSTFKVYPTRAAGTVASASGIDPDISPSPDYPDPPRNVRIQYPSFGTGLEIYWNRSSDATYYQIYTCKGYFSYSCDNVSDFDLESTRVTSTSYRMANILTTHKYIGTIIVACNSAGCEPEISGAFAGVEIVPTPIPIPSYPEPPTNIQVRESAYGSGLEVTWDRSRSATHYQVYICQETTKYSSTCDTFNGYQLKGFHVPVTRYSVRRVPSYVKSISAIVIACNIEGCPSLR